MQPRLNYFAYAPELLVAARNLNEAINASGLETSLIHLIKLRASQINGCSFCVEMHAREAREDGETNKRLDLVAAWRESPLFTDRERAAFAWTEAVTKVSEAGVSDELYEATRAAFSEEDLVKLTAAVAMINTWNRLSVSFRAIHPMPAEAA